MSDVSPTGGAGASASKRRWVWPLLIVSLAVNLFVLGIMFGHHVIGRHGPGWHHRGVHAILSHIPKDDRQKVRAALCEAVPDFRALRRDMRKRRRDLHDMLDQDSVDYPALQQRLEEIIDERAKTRKDALPRVIEVMKLVPAEDRAGLLRLALHPRGRRGLHKLCR